ncbi:MAG: hypothetical protein ACYCQI_04360 [Gammaproteobacteria bacterium]
MFFRNLKSKLFPPKSDTTMNTTKQKLAQIDKEITEINTKIDIEIKKHNAMIAERKELPSLLLGHTALNRMSKDIIDLIHSYDSYEMSPSITDLREQHKQLLSEAIKLVNQQIYEKIELALEREPNIGRLVR